MAKLLTKEQHDYLISIQKGKTSNEVATLMNAKFGLSLIASQIKNYRKNHSLHSGLTGHFPKGNIPFNKGKKFPNMPPNSGQFSKGNRPKNCVPVGTICYTTDGYPKRKIAEPNVWEYCHKKEWELHYGPIPDGFAVIFLNGDKTNWDISNLACLSRSELARMNQNHYFSEDAELTKAGMGVVKIKNKIKELGNG